MVAALAESRLGYGFAEQDLGLETEAEVELSKGPQ